MRRSLQAAGLLLAIAALGQSEQKRGGKEAPPPAAAHPGTPANKGGGGPANKGGAPPKQLGPRITNPNSIAAKLYQATPEERDRVIEKLPAARQEAIRKNLEWFDHQAPKDQQTILKRAERFANLTPEKRFAFEQQLQAWQRLPQDRKIAVGVALRALQTMPDEKRIETLNRPAFRERFSPEEWKMISDLSEVMLPQM